MILQKKARETVFQQKEKRNTANGREIDCPYFDFAGEDTGT